MRTPNLLAIAFLGLSIAACGSSSSQDPSSNGDPSAEQDIKSGKGPVVGSWQIDPSSQNLTSTVSYEFKANGDFSRVDNRILNGIFVQGAPRPTVTTSGRYQIDEASKLITLTITAPIKGTEVVAFDYQPARVLNGMFLPGHEPDTRESLTLTEQPAPMSHVAYPALKFRRADASSTAE